MEVCDNIRRSGIAPEVMSECKDFLGTILAIPLRKTFQLQELAKITFSTSVYTCLIGLYKAISKCCRYVS